MNKLLLVSHRIATQGLIDKFEGFLSKKYDVCTILNPLEPKTNLKSVVRWQGQKKEYKIPAQLQFILEGWLSWRVFKKVTGKKFKPELVIAFDSVAFVHTYFWRRFFGVKKFIFYNQDYSPERFKNKLGNYIYHSFNRYAFKKCDYFFCTTPEIVDDLDPQKQNREKAHVLSHIVEIFNDDIKRKEQSIIFAGSISYTVNFENLLQALKKIKDENIKFIFDIYGDGPDKPALQKRVADLELDKQVSFFGPVENQKLIREILPSHMIGVSPYITKKTKGAPDHMFHGVELTAKQVEYIAAGLPLLSTFLYDAFNMIKENKFGYIVYEADEWYNALKEMLTDKNAYQEYRDNAKEFAKRYDANIVVGSLIEKILNK